MGNFANSESVIIKNVRVTWLDIFKPGEGSNGFASKYKVSGLIDPKTPGKNPETGLDDIAFGPAAVAKKAMADAAKMLWPENYAAVIKAMDSKSKALRRGDDQLADDGSVRAGYAGMLYLSCSNKSQPQVVAQRSLNGKKVHITENGRGQVGGMDVTDQLNYPITVPYRGCYCNLKVTFTAGKAHKKGETQLPNQIFAKIEAVQFLRDGEAFGAGPTSAEGFDDEEVSDDPMAGGGTGFDDMDDDIPF